MVYPKGNSVGKSWQPPKAESGRPAAPGSAHPVPGPRRDRWDGEDGGWPKWVSSKKPRDLTKIFKHYQLNIFWYPGFLFLGIFGVLVKVFPWVFAIFMPVLKLIGVLDVVPTLVRFHGATKCREMPIPEVSQPTAWQPGKSQVLHAHQATGPGLQRVCTLDTLAL